MLDLGASINVMPYFVFYALNIGTLKEIGIVVQLADRFNVYPREVLEDVLVKVNKFVFLIDFYVLDMEDDNNFPLLHGHPFMTTAKTKIDVHQRYC